MSQQAYDLVVIGAGPGGYIAAVRAAQLGLRTAIVDRRAALGGTCLNVGCIPSKALLESSRLFASAGQDLAAHGVVTKEVGLDLAAMMQRKHDVVSALTNGVAGLMKKNRIQVLQGSARIASPESVEVGAPADCILQTRHIVIATGSAPVELPHLPFDGRRIVSSTDALAFSAVPQRLLVVGGGAVGLELGSVWNRLGSQVVVAELMQQIVPGTDLRTARLLDRALRKQGLDIRLGTKAVAAQVDTDTVTVTLESSKGQREDATFDAVLVAVGRKAVCQGLDAAVAGVVFDDRGRIQIDDRYRTAVAGIFAIGDVVAGPMLAHKAEEEGVACAEIIAGHDHGVRYDLIPSVVYTWPELATVGLSAEAAKEQDRKVKVGAFPFMASARARCTGDADGAVRVIADAQSDEILGVHIVGPHASELVAEAVVAMRNGQRSRDLAETIHAHPTLSEALKEAALAVHGRALNA